MNWLHVLVALLLVTAGRRLFWLFVACIGFVAGYGLAEQAFTNANPQELLIIGLILGFIGMFVAFFVQKAAIALGGFLAGSYITIVLLDILAVDPSGPGILFLAVGGLIGALTLFAVFDAALVLLSSIAGAALFVQLATPNPPFDALLFVVIAVFGMLFQFRLVTRPPRPVHS